MRRASPWVALKVKSKILKFIRNETGNQCSWRSTGVMWQNLPCISANLAAAFWALCNLSSWYLGRSYNRLLPYSLFRCQQKSKWKSLLNHWKVFPDAYASNVVQAVTESNTAYFGNVYSHSKLVIEPRTQIPHNHFAYITIPYPDGVNSNLL